MKKLILDSQQAQALADGVYLGGDYVFVDSEYAGEWRWGVNYQIVIEDIVTKELWATTYQVQVGDNYYNSLEDGPVHFYPVERVEKTIVEYKRIKDA